MPNQNSKVIPFRFAKKPCYESFPILPLQVSTNVLTLKSMGTSGNLRSNRERSGTLGDFVAGTAVNTTVGGIALLKSVLPRTSFHSVSAGTALPLLMFFCGVNGAGRSRIRWTGPGLKNRAVAHRCSHDYWELHSTIVIVEVWFRASIIAGNTNSIGTSWICDE